jgi:DNA mismatch repair ATPase MutS
VDAPGSFEAEQTFDIVLAARLSRHDPVVQSVRLQNRERIIVVTGPNQGGKTTFARTVGQLHELARLGFPVPGRQVVLSVCDRVFTHFERGEDMTDLRGKLLDDLLRVKEILEAATPSSVVILNEIFTSTSAVDAVALSTRILERLNRIGALCICVTFLDELARLDERTVSLVAGVAADDPTRRTFQMERRPADGRAFAAALAAKHGLDYRRLRQELSS